MHHYAARIACMQHLLDRVVAEVASVPDGLSAADVARRAGINRSTLHRITRGAVEPSLSTLRELAIVHGLDVSVQLRPLSDPDAADAARLLLDPDMGPAAESDVESDGAAGGGPSSGVREWVDRLGRVADLARPPADGDDTPVILKILSVAGRAADLRRRPGAVLLQGRRDALRLASAGEASGARWAVSGGAALEVWDRAGGTGAAIPVPGILWVSDVTSAAALLKDTHRSIADVRQDEGPQSAGTSDTIDVVVAQGSEEVFRGSVEIDGVRFVAPVQQLIDACGCGPTAERHALGVIGRRCP